MTFDSYQFLLFLPTVLLLYFSLAPRFRWALLLVASCVFYMVFVPAYILILFLIILIDYSCGLGMDRSGPLGKKIFLTVSILSNLTILGFFKYANFISHNLNLLNHWLGWGADIPVLHYVLPIGLSFHTFQSISYTIEVYRGAQKVERHLGIFALYVLFFPQMVAGPIERPQNLLHQLRTPQRFDYVLFIGGLRAVLFGLFKKILVADLLAGVVDPVFNDPIHHSQMEMAWAALFFPFQIYFDFSAYSQIAIGSAQMMGYRLMTNFNLPYTASSLREFWTRWHISLSTWFKDYVYIPLGGNRVGVAKNCRNLLIVFALSGVWHGANYTFMVWGLLHGLALIFTIFLGQLLPRRFFSLPGVKALGWASTFTFTALAWVFFRARNMRDALLVLKSVVAVVTGHAAQANVGFFPTRAFAAFAVAVIITFGLEPLLARGRQQQRSLVDFVPISVRFAVYAVAILAIANLGTCFETPFIYFQF